MTEYIWKNSIVVFLTFAVGLLQAQVIHRDLDKYKKKYPEESVVVLNTIRECKIDFGSSDSIEITQKEFQEHLYLDKNAAQFSERVIHSTFFYELENIEAKVLVPVSEKKYKTIKIKDFTKQKALSEDVFFDDGFNTKFFLKDLKEGAKSQITEEYRLKEPKLLSAMLFGSSVNIEYQEYKITVHKNISLRFQKFNGVDTLVNYEKSEKGDYITYKWVAREIPAFEYEGSAPSIRNFLPHIYPVIESYTINGKSHAVLKDVNDLHDWYSDLIAKVNLDPVPEVKALVDSITMDIPTEAEKVQTIFEWVQKNIKYIAIEDGLGGFIPRDPVLVFKRRFGDCKDVSFLQVYMAGLIGIQVYPAWVGTRAIPYSYEELASPGCDNHMIGAYNNNGDWIFLDATGTYSNYGFPSAFFQGKEILVHKGNEAFEIVTADVVDHDKNTIEDAVSLKIEGADLIGEGEIKFSGYEKIYKQYDLLDADSTEVTEYLKSFLQKGSNKFFLELKELNLEGKDYGAIEYGFSVKDYLKWSGDEVYVNLNLVKIYSKNRIRDTRTLPYENKYKFRNKFYFELDVSGFAVDYLPESTSFENDAFSYALTYSHVGDKIKYSLEVNTNHLVLETEQFDEWNDMVRSLNKSYKEVVVLKKK